MEIVLVDLPEIAVIGKEGLCTEQQNIVPVLWQEANTHFPEVAELGLKAPDGTYLGFWGAMSDEGKTFQPWTHQFSRGLYLAGIQTEVTAQAPEGWTKWILPARTYLVIDVSPETYGDTFREVIRTVLPERRMKLAGAVCDYTEPSTGKSKLYFPVEVLTKT